MKKICKEKQTPKMSAYIHIPFCSKICAYCDFPKVLKKDEWVDEYLKALENEIKQNYKGEEIETIYIGGGTPSSLDIKSLNKLFDIIKIFHTKKDTEITLEANSEDLNDEKLEFLKGHINRLSIGVQTFNQEKIKELNRTLNIKNLRNAFNYFTNINIDLMYGFKGQSIKDVKKDLDNIINLNPAHISTYSLILEPNTKLFIDHYQEIDEDIDRKMYDLINKTLKENKYIHYEISNYAKKDFESKHNLVYWNNQNYYGFGLGASGYIKNIRYENTRSLTDYLKGKYKLHTHILDINETIQNEFMLGFRKTKGINKQNFKEKYNININDIKEIQKLKEKNFLNETGTNIFINQNYLYTSNEILVKLIDFALHEQ